MKHILWTFGLGLAGFFIGGKAAGGIGFVIGSIWGGSIGFGFGGIFTETKPTKRLLVFWGITLALVGPLFGVVVYAVPRSYVSTAQLASAGAVGAVVGGLIGLAFGALHLNYLRRRLDGFRLRDNDAPD
jgi:hypothetical protein